MASVGDYERVTTSKGQHLSFPVLNTNTSAARRRGGPERRQGEGQVQRHTSGEELLAEELLAIGVAPLEDADRSMPPPLLLLLATARPAAARTATPPSPMATLGPPTGRKPRFSLTLQMPAAKLCKALTFPCMSEIINADYENNQLALGDTGTASSKAGSVGQERCSLGASAGTDGTGSDGVAAGLPACGAGAGAIGGSPAFGGAFGGSGVLRKDGGAGPPGYGTVGALGCSNGAAGAAVHSGQPRVRHQHLLK